MSRVAMRWVAAGVGLPQMFVFIQHGPPTERIFGWLGVSYDNLGYDEPDRLDTDDPQTRAGLLRQLAMWAGDDGKAQAYWLIEGGNGYVLMRNNGYRVASFLDTTRPTIENYYTVPGVLCGARDALSHILTYIGMDHHIHQTLGWEVQPGALATLQMDGESGFWTLTAPFGEGMTQFQVFHARGGGTVMGVPALDGATDPEKVLKAIAMRDLQTLPLPTTG